MKMHFLGSPKRVAQQTVKQLIDRYGQNEIAKESYVVPISGDGTRLNALQAGRLSRGATRFGAGRAPSNPYADAPDRGSVAA